MRRCALVVGVVLAGVAVPAHAAGPMLPDTFLVCGRGNTVPGGSGCISLQAAITKATPISGTVTIEMMPGDYCPPVFPPINTVYWQHLNFVGIGLGAYGPTGAPTSFTGPEAKLTTFSWSSVCGGSTPAAVVEVDSGGTGQVGLTNLTVEGGASGPSTGVFANNSSVAMHDVIVENFTGTGVTATSTSPSTGLSVQNSSIAHNTGAGLVFSGTVTGNNFVSVQRSTIADNGVGIQQSGNLGANLLSDTIAHNSTGFTGATSQVADTVNADNTTNCGSAGWEGSGTNSHNLVGSDCPHAGDGDIVSTAAVPALAANGGPTYSILPPTQAAGQGVGGFCGDYDQREYKRTDPSTCDIGAVEVGHSSSLTSVDAYPVPGTDDLGFVPAGIQGGDLFRVYSTGAGLVYGYDVTVSGAGFSIVGENCSHTVLESGMCSVGVYATPSPAHPHITGTLTVKMSTGDLVWSLAAHGPDATSLTAPVGATITYGAHRTLTTTLTDTTTHHAVSGAAVTLQAKAAGQSAFGTLATRATSSTGAVAIAVGPRTDTQYRWVFAGSDTLYAVTSAAATVHVAQAVKATLSAGTVTHGKAVTVGGSVAPNENGQKVVLQVVANHQWVTIGTGLVHGAAFALTTKFATAGTRSLRVVRPATSQNALGVSATLALHVT